MLFYTLLHRHRRQAVVVIKMEASVAAEASVALKGRVSAALEAGAAEAVEDRNREPATELSEAASRTRKNAITQVALYHLIALSLSDVLSRCFCRPFDCSTNLYS